MKVRHLHRLLRRFHVNTVIEPLLSLSFRGYLRWLDFRHRVPIVVYQMGKVGSTTVVTSLRALPLERPVWHIHTLNPSELKKMRVDHLSHERAVAGIEYWEGKELHHLLESSKQSEKLSVISLTREPVARNVFAFFQRLDHWYPDFDQQMVARGEEAVFADLREIFIKDYHHECPLYWFDNEVRSMLGIDVYDSPFFPEQGYAHYENDKTKLLVIRLDNLSEQGPALISKFLALDARDFPLIEKNVRERLSYGNAYRHFVKHLSLPSTLLEKMYTSKYVQHFYSEDEVKGFKTRWEGSKKINFTE